MKIYIARIENKGHKLLSNHILEYAYNDMCGKNMDIKKIHKGQYGKPYYDDKFYFNISHSKNYVVVAVDEDEVGIDIEESRYVSPSLTKRILTKNERIMDGDVLNNWVLKEAYVKYLGVGLYLDFRNIDTGTILKSENVANLSTKDYYCFLVSKTPTRAKVIWLDDKDLFTQRL